MYIQLVITMLLLVVSVTMLVAEEDCNRRNSWSHILGSVTAYWMRSVGERVKQSED
jgi:hypothetical protein